MAKRGNAMSAPIDRGTPETRRHKRRSTMERLIETGRIGGYELRAAQEIEKVFYFIAGGLLSRTMRYDERTDPSSSNDVPEWFLSAYHKRYKPFADDPQSGFQVCIEVLVDGRSGRTIDTERKWPRGTAVSVLVNALRSYAPLAAGWPDIETAKQWRRPQAA